MKGADWIATTGLRGLDVETYVFDYQWARLRFTRSSGRKCKLEPSMVIVLPLGSSNESDELVLGMQRNLSRTWTVRVFLVSFRTIPVNPIFVGSDEADTETLRPISS